DTLSPFGQILPFIDAQWVLDNCKYQTVYRVFPTGAGGETGPKSLQWNSPRVLTFENPADPLVATADSWSTPVLVQLNVQSTIVQPGGGAATWGGLSYCWVWGSGTSPGGGTNPTNGLINLKAGLKPIRLSQITDGLSNTLFMGPRPFTTIGSLPWN